MNTKSRTDPLTLVRTGRKASVRPQGMKPTESIEVLSIMPRSSTTSAIGPRRRLEERSAQDPQKQGDDVGVSHPLDEGVDAAGGEGQADKRTPDDAPPAPVDD